MNHESIFFASQVIDIAEHKTYLELTSRICYYDDVNLNNMMLPYDDTSEARAETLVNMPVQAKYKVNSKGEPTFGGHEMFKNSKGEVVFNTSSIGTHTQVYIEEDTIETANGETKTLPCLFAKYRVWKRYKNVIEAVKRLFNLNKLFSSWEIRTSAYEVKDGIKKLTDYIFEANTLLGFEYAKPSYGESATAFSLATEGSELLIAEAFSQDLIENLDGGINENMKNAEEKNLSTDQADVKTSSATDDKSEKTEVAQLTEWDLRKKIREACQKKLGGYCYVAFHFPNEKEVWVEKDCRESELDYVKFTYTVENDEVTMSEPENVALTVAPKSINTVVAELNDKITQKDDAIIKSGEKITELNTEISELTPFKEKFEMAEQEKIEAETKEKRTTLVASITKSGFITEDEIEASEELKGYVENLDEKSLKAIVAERFIASLDSTKEEDTVCASTESQETASVNLNILDGEVNDKKSIMKNYISGGM